MLASVAAAGLVLAVVHPTYAIFLWLPFAGFLVVRSLVARDEAGRIAAALAALVLPAAAFFAWLLPVVRDTASHAPGEDELHRAFTQYAGQLDVSSDTSYRLAPEVFGRAGAIAVAALLFVPLAGARAPPTLGRVRSRWLRSRSLAVMLVSSLFVRFSDLVSISQSRRAAGFWPLSFAFAGGFVVLAALLRGLVAAARARGRDRAPARLSGRVRLRAPRGRAGARDLDRGRRRASSRSCVGLWRRPAIERRAPSWASLPASSCCRWPCTAAANWSPSEARTASPLTPGLVEALRDDVPEGAIVYSDLETSYRIAAEAPVYIAAAPPGHVADTEENRPYERRAENIRFFRTGDVAIPRRAGARWLVLDRKRFDIVPQLDSVYRDSRYTLYVVP